MIIQARLHRAHMLAKAQHDTELFGLDAENSGQSPDRQGADQNQRDTQAAEIAARQQLLQPVLSAAQKVFEIGRPWPDRLRSRAPRPFRTRAPGASALILPRHRQSPSAGPSPRISGETPGLPILAASTRLYTSPPPPFPHHLLPRPRYACT